MFLELALVLPLYIVILYVLIRYRHLIKAKSSLNSLLSTLPDEDDVVDAPEEGVVQRKKRETLKYAINHGKVHFLPAKKKKWK